MFGALQVTGRDALAQRVISSVVGWATDVAIATAGPHVFGCEHISAVKIAS